MTTQQAFGIKIHLQTDFAAAIQRVTAALKDEGFGILTEIDVKATLKKKMDVDFRPYVILGACNPPLAYRALQAAPEIGLLLPCNVTVSQEDADTCLVHIIDPLAMMGFVNNPDLQTVADEAQARLERVALTLKEE